MNQRKYFQISSCFFLFLLFAVVCHGSVIYEYRQLGSGLVLGELEFQSPPASATSGWTATSPLLVDDLEGGVSGFRWNFGSGLETAVGFAVYGAPLPPLYEVLSSDDGSTIDSGAFAGEFSFPSGFPNNHVSDLIFDDVPGLDFVLVYSAPFSGLVEGDWILQDPIPEPSTLVLFGLGFLGLVGYAYRRKHCS
ncbi:PEP-CTERM sorting domain-containing protein [bacterium]|nr:PEP-CTERM sorting domain-containing protein [bacterium]